MTTSHDDDAVLADVLRGLIGRGFSITTFEAGGMIRLTGGLQVGPAELEALQRVIQEAGEQRYRDYAASAPENMGYAYEVSREHR